MDEMRDVLSLEFGGIPRTGAGGESQRPGHDLESVHKTGSIYSPVDYARQERIDGHVHAPRDGVVSSWHNANDDVQFPLIGAPVPHVPGTVDRRIGNEKHGPTGREIIATTAFKHNPGSHSTARITRAAVENILLPQNSSKHNVRSNRPAPESSRVRTAAVQNILLPQNSSKHNVRSGWKAGATGPSNIGGAARNVLLPYVNADEQTKREFALSAGYDHTTPGSKSSLGEPALYSAQVVERPGDSIKAISAQDGLARPAHGHHMFGTAADQNVNPHDIWYENNRTSYEDVLARAGGANMSNFTSLHQQGLSRPDYSRADGMSLREQTQVFGTPDPSLLAAFRGNDLVPVPVK